jgi:hypothetical protein
MGLSCLLLCDSDSAASAGAGRRVCRPYGAALKHWAAVLPARSVTARADADCCTGQTATKLLNMHILLRRVLLLLFCLALPFSALQAMAAPASPCAMQAGDMDKQMTPAGDCCADHSKPCGKAGQPCQSASLLLMALSTTPALPLSRPLLAMGSLEVFPVQSPKGVWRPPRL